MLVNKNPRNFDQPLPLDLVEVQLDSSYSSATGVLVLADDQSCNTEYIGLVLFDDTFSLSTGSIASSVESLIDLVSTEREVAESDGVKFYGSILNTSELEKLYKHGYRKVYWVELKQVVSVKTSEEYIFERIVLNINEELNDKV